MKGTTYIAAELTRLGPTPAGDNGTFVQVLPYHLRAFTNHSQLTVRGNPLRWERDWVVVPGPRAPRPINVAEVVFGGTAGDTSQQLAPGQATGKFIVLLAPPAPARSAALAPGRFAPPAPSRFADAAAVAIVDLDPLTPAQRTAINVPTVATQSTGGRGRPGARAPAGDSLTLLRQQVEQLAPRPSLRLTSEAATRLFGVRSVDALTPGVRGGTLTASLDDVELPSDYARNVVAINPGSDPALAGQYVAIGAHNDHVGPTTPVDKDALKAFNNERNKRLLANNVVALTPTQLGEIRVNMDSLRRRIPTARLDSISNGAGDDGSGSMAVLEIAEYLQAMKVKPKRSTLFVWHIGEEVGLIGSAFFTRNPTAPMDSVVSQLNIDMIGRGREGDLRGGSPDYLGVVGSCFDSKDLGEAAAAVNRKQENALAFDYKCDSTLAWTGENNIYQRSDQHNYALQGVPIAFFFTGLHGDYHQRSDEAEFIDYPHYACITSYIRDLAVDVSNGPRPRMNGTRPARPTRTIVP